VGEGGLRGDWGEDGNKLRNNEATECHKNSVAEASETRVTHIPTSPLRITEKIIRSPKKTEGNVRILKELGSKKCFQYLYIIDNNI